MLLLFHVALAQTAPPSPQPPLPPRPPPPPPPPPLPPVSPGGLCSDSCWKAGDGLCTDGGPGSQTVWYANVHNGNFDHSSYMPDYTGPRHDCAYGTDCTDCGVRNASFAPPTFPPIPPAPPPMPPITPGGAVCTNTCDACAVSDDQSTCARFQDGHCDDGGPGSRSAQCPVGTDCADCGTRLAPPRAHQSHHAAALTVHVVR